MVRLRQGASLFDCMHSFCSRHGPGGSSAGPDRSALGRHRRRHSHRDRLHHRVVRRYRDVVRDRLRHLRRRRHRTGGCVGHPSRGEVVLRAKDRAHRRSRGRRLRPCLGVHLSGGEPPHGVQPLGQAASRGGGTGPGQGTGRCRLCKGPASADHLPGRVRRDRGRGNHPHRG